MKYPSFQFYPSDWLSDTKLRSCSMEARGLAIDLFCIMHDHDPYGHCPNSIPTLSRLLREDPRKLRRLLDELLLHKVIKPSEKRPEFFYSSRMIRDEAIREKRRSDGKLGGNPKLKVNQTSPGLLPNISPTSPEHLPNISRTSPEDRSNIFETSPEHLADISRTSRRTLSEEIKYDNELRENEVNHLDNALSKDRLTLESKSCTPPSSSSSSSSSEKKKTKDSATPKKTRACAFILPSHFPKESWEEWMTLRKKKRATNSDYAMKLLADKVQLISELLGLSVQEIIDMAIIRNWIGIEESWVKASIPASVTSSKTSQW